jgi:hypothetical protein
MKHRMMVVFYDASFPGVAWRHLVSWFIFFDTSQAYLPSQHHSAHILDPYPDCTSSLAHILILVINHRLPSTTITHNGQKPQPQPQRTRTGNMEHTNLPIPDPMCRPLLRSSARSRLPTFRHDRRIRAGHRHRFRHHVFLRGHHERRAGRDHSQ